MSIGGSSAAAARMVAVKGRAVAGNVAQFGRYALASDMPPLRRTCAQGRAREASSAFAKRRAKPSRRPAPLRPGLFVSSPRGEQEG